jgi:glutamyl-tRNA reductase
MLFLRNDNRALKWVVRRIRRLSQVGAESVSISAVAGTRAHRRVQDEADLSSANNKSPRELGVSLS